MVYSKLIVGHGAHESLSRVNRYRDKEGAPCWLSIDFKLSDDAQDLAEHLAGNKSGTYDKATRRYPDSKGYAHTITTSSDSLGGKEAIAAVDAWYETRHKITMSPEGNAWSQMMWGSTTHYGIGGARNYDSGKTVIVAFFYPPGNIDGEWDRNIPNWNHAEFIKTCDSIWHGGEPGKFSMNARINRIEDQALDKEDEFWSKYDERVEEEQRTTGGGAVMHSVFTHKSRVIYSSDEEQPVMDYYERAKLGAATTFQSTSRYIDSDENESVAVPAPRQQRNVEHSFSHRSVAYDSETEEMIPIDSDRPFVNSYMRQYAGTAVQSFQIKSRVVDSDYSTDEDVNESILTKSPDVEEEEKEVSPKSTVEKEETEKENEKADSGVDQPTTASTASAEDASDYQFTKAVQVKANFDTEWKNVACNGTFEYAGLTEFAEPHFKRRIQNQDVFLSLWGKQGKKKWRIGPDVNSKVCWCYTKKWSPDFGVPATGWYQSHEGAWQAIDIKITVK